MKCKLRAEDLKKIVKGTKKFVNSSAYHAGELMRYVKIDVDKDTMQLTATALDGYRISIEKCGAVECDCSFSCYIKPMLPKMSKKLMYAEIEYDDTKDNHKAYLIADEYIIGFKQPDGEWYKINKIFDDLHKPTAKVAVNAKTLRDALDSFTCVGNMDNTVKLEIRDPREPITIRNWNGDIKLVLPVHVDDEHMED